MRGRRIVAVLGTPSVVVVASLVGASPGVAEPGAGGSAGTVSGYRPVVLTSGEASALDLNDRGEVVGWAGAPYAVLWSVGAMRFLEKPASLWTSAAAVNNRSVVAGAVSAPGGPWRAVLWTRGARRNLGFDGSPSAVNDHGIVVGTVRPRTGPAYAFRWSNGRLTSLTRFGVRPGDALQVTDVNEAGQLVGKDASGPFRLTGSHLERPPRTSGMLDAAAITERGDVVGTRSAGGVGWEAVVWTASGQVRSVGTIGSYGPGGKRLGGVVRDVNERGQIVGDTVRFVADGSSAVQDSAPFVLDHGVLRLLPAPRGQWTGFARRINNSGVVIGGSGLDVVEWIPYPTP